MQIVKAEMLWTRKCPLKCGYCAMPDGRKNSQPIEYWRKTANALANLGCGFAAFYGAEPLFDDIDKLGACIQAFEQKGIKTTVITSGCVSGFDEKVETIYNYGLRSLSMSYDIVAIGKSSAHKSSLAISNLTKFLKRENVRDAAAIATLTRKNFRNLPQSIEELSKLGIWTFFDMIHNDRRQPGSKVKDTPETRELMFQEEDLLDLKKVLIEVSKMKAFGYLCHTSDLFLDLICREDFYNLKNYSWNCAMRRSFPAWVTIDCDGSVYPCDDFHVSHARFEACDIDKQFGDFEEFYRQEVLQKCPGCIWNTHYDAHMIKEGKLKFSSYVHKEE